MPKRTDIKSILIIGAGPIVIGQACEFDYSGTQACKALREEGYRVILLNSNPATIMTDPETADATYVEPITVEVLEKIIQKEKPDAILPTVGGQTALNCALNAAQAGILEKYNVQLIGADAKAIEKAENRDLFNKAMINIGLKTPKNVIVSSLPQALEALKEIGLPTIIRPSFTLGGSGGGVAYNKEEFVEIIKTGLDMSPIRQVQIDQSLLGWKEYEMEVVRDKADNSIIICSIENIDPMGIHTGDSITVAPTLTLTDKEYQIMRNASIAILREIGVETGGSNVQFAVNPDDGELLVIEMNPRVSRSSALASKATGFPIAKVAAKLAIGYTLDEISNDITKTTPASFEPSIDYVVTKIPRFTFEKFNKARPELSSAMKSVGESMAIGRTFSESMQKALCSMETGFTGFNEVSFQGYSSKNSAADNKKLVSEQLAKFTTNRILHVAQAMRYGLSIDEINAITKHDKWFLEQIANILATEETIREAGVPQDKATLLDWKKQGFSDSRIAELTKTSETEIRELRHNLEIRPVYKRVDTCAAEFASHANYMYSCYEGNALQKPSCEANISDKKKIIILGSGPNRIGQGIEFDYTCVHASFALRDCGYETIMVNCNPETVSTDYDTSSRLYFEPLTFEFVLELAKNEQSNGDLLGVIVQYGGQTPLKLAKALEDAGIPIIGTSPDKIDLAEDRDRFQKLLHKLELRQPPNALCDGVANIASTIAKIGFPVVIRPSHVLGGRAMAVVYDDASLAKYLSECKDALIEGPILVDGFLSHATEIDVDAICDGDDVFISGIMEHVEYAGIHSGDSACSLPTYSVSEKMLSEIKASTKKLAFALEVKGLMNIQFAVKNDELFILEVNPRASRTVPFVAKASGVPVAKIAAQIMAGKKLKEFALEEDKPLAHYAVKEAVFPFERFDNVDVILGPEMKSTGEVMGIDKNFALAFAKAQIAAHGKMPLKGNVFLSVEDSDKDDAIEIARDLSEAGFMIYSTQGTQEYLQAQKIPNVFVINKVKDGSPHIVDKIAAHEIHLVINTTGSDPQSIADSFSIRRTTLINKVVYFTTIRGAKAGVKAIQALNASPLQVKSLQEYN
jgi:carbamoyl-phosphate synthase large subunit